MKKTIAKIMAAAMVLSTIPAVALPTLTADAAGINALVKNEYPATFSKVEIMDANNSDKVVASVYDKSAAAAYTKADPLVLTGITSDTYEGTITSLTTKLKADAAFYTTESNYSEGDQVTTVSVLGSGPSTTGVHNASVDADDLDDVIYASSFDYANSDQKGLFTSIDVDSRGYVMLYVNNQTYAQNIIKNLSSAAVTAQIKFRVDTDVVGDVKPSTSKDVITSATSNSDEYMNLWVKIGATSTSAGADSTVYTENNVAIPLKLNVNDTAKTVEIVEADPNKTGKTASGAAEYIYKTDAVKGETLLLNTVKVNGEDYKIVKIHSRVFKEAKFKKIQAKNLKHINSGAFRKNKQLKQVNLGTDRMIRKIHSKAFYDCKKLATIKLDGRKLKEVGSEAFQGVKKNCKIKVKGNKTQYNKAVKKLKKGVKSTKVKFARI